MKSNIRTAVLEVVMSTATKQPAENMGQAKLTGLIAKRCTLDEMNEDYPGLVHGKR